MVLIRFSDTKVVPLFLDTTPDITIFNLKKNIQEYRMVYIKSISLLPANQQLSDEQKSLKECGYQIGNGVLVETNGEIRSFVVSIIISNEGKYEFSVLKTDKIFQLKRRIEIQFPQLKFQNQVLFYPDKQLTELNDDKTFEDYGILSSCTLNLRLQSSEEEMDKNVIGKRLEIEKAENYDDNVAPDFMCSICMQIFNKPLVLQNCGHVFCGSCISEWLQSHYSCPVCRRDTTLDQLKSVRFINNLLEKLPKRCRFQRLGCQWKGTDLQEHLKECNYSFRECPYHGCYDILEKQNFENHVQQCFYRPIKCKCGGFVSLKNLKVRNINLTRLKSYSKDHQETQCPFCN